MFSFLVTTASRIFHVQVRLILFLVHIEHPCHCYLRLIPASIMNWTEGNLNRHSRARKGKEILLRQKEHFAKARAGRLDANVKISPPLLSFLATQVQSPVRHDALKSSSSRTHPSGGRLLSSRYFSEASVKLPKPAAFSEQQSEEEAMRQKRRRLLLKGDWVSTNMQKPIEMEFMKPRGSPSNPWSLKKSRRQTSKQKLRRLLGVTHEGGRSKARGSAATVSPTSLRRMKIRVGSHERALGDSSNASPKSNGRQGELTGICGRLSREGKSRRKLFEVWLNNDR